MYLYFCFFITTTTITKTNKKIIVGWKRRFVFFVFESYSTTNKFILWNEIVYIIRLWSFSLEYIRKMRAICFQCFSSEMTFFSSCHCNEINKQANLLLGWLSDEYFWMNSKRKLISFSQSNIVIEMKDFTVKMTVKSRITYENKTKQK